MTKLIFTIIAAFCISNAALAQDRMEGLRQQLKDSLQITDVQVDSIFAIQQDYRELMRNIFLDPSLSGEEKKQKTEPYRQAIRARLMPILTEEQIEHLELMQANRRMRMMQRNQR